jgi:hypothetical protein
MHYPPKFVAVQYIISVLESCDYKRAIPWSAQYAGERA